MADTREPNETQLGPEPKETLKQLEAFKDALDVASIIATTDRRGRITYVNQKFVSISGYSKEELLGKDHRIINSGYHPKEFIANMWNTITRGDVWVGDLKNRRKDGSTYWVHTTIVPFFDDDGEIEQYVAIRSDITERVRAEDALEQMVSQLAEMTDRERDKATALSKARDQLVSANQQILREQQQIIQAEKLSSIGLLASGVAHEINNPLAGIMECLKSLRRGRVSEERSEEYFTAMSDGLERIRTIVGSLLSYARPRVTRHHRFDASELVEASFRLLAPTARQLEVDLVSKLEPDSVPVFGDRSQLAQAVMNVLLNAAHASPRGSVVLVTAELTETEALISIRDEGPGIPDRDLARICDPFFSTKPEGEGTGLGLSVTRSIINAHGGFLVFDSEAGKGTTVTFRLPSGANRSEPEC